LSQNYSVEKSSNDITKQNIEISDLSDSRKYSGRRSSKVQKHSYFAELSSAFTLKIYPNLP